MMAKEDARLEQTMADWKAWQEEMRASHEEMEIELKPEMQVKTMACQEMEARQEEKEPTSVDRKPEVAQQREVLIKDAEVIPVGEPKKKRCKDRKAAADHRRQMNKRTQSQGGCRKRLAVTCRGKSRHAKWAWQEQETDKRMSRHATVA
jgi:hypothetical protein